MSVAFLTHPKRNAVQFASTPVEGPPRNPTELPLTRVVKAQFSQGRLGKLAKRGLFEQLIEVMHRFEEALATTKVFKNIGPFARGGVGNAVHCKMNLILVGLHVARHA